MAILRIFQAVLLTALLQVLALSSQCGAQQPELECENLYCTASGIVGLQNMTYPYPVSSSAQFDLVITLTSRVGDVDL